MSEESLKKVNRNRISRKEEDVYANAYRAYHGKSIYSVYFKTVSKI